MSKAIRETVIWENLNLLKATRARTLELVGGLTQGQMDWEPQPGKWSAGEQLDHLRLAASLYHNQIAELVALARAGQPTEIRRTMREIDFRPNFIPASALPMFEIPFTVANLFIPTLMRELLTRYAILPAQRPDVAQPVRGKVKAVLTGALNKSLVETVNLIEDNHNLPFSRMIVEHPVLGRSHVPFLIKLTALHEQRHQAQLAAILLKVPRAGPAAA